MCSPVGARCNKPTSVYDLAQVAGLHGSVAFMEVDTAELTLYYSKHPAKYRVRAGGCHPLAAHLSASACKTNPSGRDESRMLDMHLHVALGHSMHGVPCSATRETQARQAACEAGQSPGSTCILDGVTPNNRDGKALEVAGQRAAAQAGPC